MNDIDIKHHVLDALEFEPLLNSSHIGVLVNEGIVTLTGEVQSLSDKITAQATTSRIKGVRALVSELKVVLSADDRRKDEDIAHQALAMIAWDTTIPKDCVQIHVESGWVTLEGSLDWFSQSRAAEAAVMRLAGVAGLTNRINMTSHPGSEDVKRRLLAAFQRDPNMDPSGIQSTAFGGRVTLQGTVHSVRERALAIRVAWSTPGVTYVEDFLTVLSDRPLEPSATIDIRNFV